MTNDRAAVKDFLDQFDEQVAAAAFTEQTNIKTDALVDYEEKTSWDTWRFNHDPDFARILKDGH